VKSAFDKITAGLGDAIAHAQGEPGRARVARPIDVKALVAATGKTQQQFADSFHIPLGTVRDWSQNRRKPDAPARVLLSMIAVDCEEVERLIAAAADR
jgi:putative transcriptional regulator